MCIADRPVQRRVSFAVLHAHKSALKQIRGMINVIKCLTDEAKELFGGCEGATHSSAVQGRKAISDLVRVRS